LVYYEAYQSEKDAREREMRIKHHGNAIKQLKKRIQRSLQNVKNGAGFTLIELLIVIAILGVLGLVGLSFLTSAQKRGRDARREADLKAVQNGFEQYFAENGVYPGTCSSGSLITIAPGEDFLIPQDPKNSSPFVYTAADCDADSYCICALLELAEGGNATNTNCAWLNNGTHFCIRNLQ
jgi:prepilin-type N-terminal cleavage/methylation domain-containing protein